LSAARTYHLFISHAWPYDDYYRLVDLLDADPDFHWRNYSVGHDRPFELMPRKHLAHALRRRIRPASVVLWIAGMEIYGREWMQRELDIARDEFDKPIIAIRPRGRVCMPAVMKDYVVDEVGWSTRSIVSAIEKHAV
jgi:hypothetical protein